MFLLPLINNESAERRYFVPLPQASYCTFSYCNMANLFLVFHILLLVDSPKSSCSMSSSFLSPSRSTINSC